MTSSTALPPGRIAARRTGPVSTPGRPVFGAGCRCGASRGAGNIRPDCPCPGPEDRSTLRTTRTAGSRCPDLVLPAECPARTYSRNALAPGRTSRAGRPEGAPSRARGRRRIKPMRGPAAATAPDRAGSGPRSGPDRIPGRSRPPVQGCGGGHDTVQGPVPQLDREPVGRADRGRDGVLRFPGGDRRPGILQELEGVTADVSRGDALTS